MLRLPDQWIWDSWIADDGDLYHLYFLQAPTSLGDPGRRHTAARIGHATSVDLVTWDYRGIALAPAESGFDDLALWTGSVVRGDDGVGRMFYTALNTAGGHGVKDQKVGMVVSDDLHTWRRVSDRPVVEPDPRWYMTLGIEGDTASETWRDPFVFRDPDGDGWHMLITARQAGAPRLDDGVLAHARSADLTDWELGAPLSVPAGFGQIEVPQVRVVDGRPVLVFTCHPDEQTPAHRAKYGDYSTWSVGGSSRTGPWDIEKAEPFRAEPTLFAAPLVLDRGGAWQLIGFRNNDPDGVTDFSIIDPIPVTSTPDGHLIRA
jgi:beta-fructofuranosidase